MAPDNKPERRPELRDAWRALETDELDTASSLAEKHVYALDADLARESKKIIALVQFRNKHYATAAPLFHEVAKSSTDAADWFNVCTSATLAGDVSLGEHAFQQALNSQQASGYAQQPSIPFMRQYFACALRDRHEYKKALEQIEELRAIYEQLKITDDTFVYIRGVPFLSHTMNVAVDVFRGLGGSFDASVWIDRFASKLDDEGREYLQMVKQRLVNGT